MKLLCLDCDSTLSKIEGVDELAAIRGDEIKLKIEELTNQAMGGEVPISEIFGLRLDMIQPSAAMCEAVGQLYIDEAAVGVKEFIDEAKSLGWTPIIISGGFVQPILPFAQYLGIEEVHAVPLNFDENGDYLSFNEDAPTARNGGKPDIIKELKTKYATDEVVMVGDGISDYETNSEVTVFIGYGEFMEREKVKAVAEHFAYSFTEVMNILHELK